MKEKEKEKKKKEEEKNGIRKTLIPIKQGVL